MKIIVQDVHGMLDAAHRQALHATGLQVYHEVSPEAAVARFVQEPETRLFVVLLHADEQGLDDELLRLQGVDPTLQLVCVYQAAGTPEALKGALPGVKLLFLQFDPAPPVLARRILELAEAVPVKRRAHRAVVELRAELFYHDETDQKIEESSRPVRVISLSSNGVYIADPRPDLITGETVLFEMPLEDYIFLVKGEVVWVNTASRVSSRPPGYALRFLDFSRAPEQLMRSFVESDMIDGILQKQAE